MFKNDNASIIMPFVRLKRSCIKHKKRLHQWVLRLLDIWLYVRYTMYQSPIWCSTCTVKHVCDHVRLQCGCLRHKSFVGHKARHANMTKHIGLCRSVVCKSPLWHKSVVNQISNSHDTFAACVSPQHTSLDRMLTVTGNRDMDKHPNSMPSLANLSMISMSFS